MNARGAVGPSDVPCLGEVLLEAGQLGSAIRWLRAAIRAPGARNDLRRLLGLAFWLTERPKEARRQWLAWLLGCDPDMAMDAAASLPDPDILRVVRTHGAESAPAWAWLEGLAPLLPEDDLPALQTRPLDLYRHLLAAEIARQRGDLDAAVLHRTVSLHLDREFLRRYMDRLC